MKRFARKFAVFLVIILGITFVSFALIYIAPGDPARLMLEANGMQAEDSALAALREEMGLNRPMPVQYLSWLWGLLHGDMGMSYRQNRPVTEAIFAALPNTLMIALGAIVLTLVISTAAGVGCAVKKDRPFDVIVRMLTFIFASTPNFFLALLILYFFGMRMNIFPVIGTTSALGGVMPVLTLALGSSAWYIRQIRTIVLEELNKEYVTGIYARGVSWPRILFGHVLKNAMIPIVTMIGISFGSMLGGAVVVENIFTWPGIGKLAVDAISARDYPLIQGFVVWISLIYFAVNTALEYVYGILDPRIRTNQRKNYANKRFKNQGRIQINKGENGHE